MSGLCESGNEPPGSLKAISKGKLKKLPTDGCTGRNGEREKSSGQKISDDDDMICGSYAEIKGRQKIGLENAGFAVKDLPMGRILDEAENSQKRNINKAVQCEIECETLRNVCGESDVSEP
ncbi:hypothetical protein ANN_17623 [Periplaneta americana]|uniref:Uncharacterized protein n=1 Tax=Periplaneta americana TaxID=6978 RepID=A0ABQ8SUH0_PERAM|nr:hypothetical protein ANN_17623 [Periplaneta americana]